jgi:hypothetical protein
MLKREVRCSCGALNRLRLYWVSQRPKCGACGVLLPEPGMIRGLRRVLHNQGAILLASGAIVAFILWRTWVPLQPTPDTVAASNLASPRGLVPLAYTPEPAAPAARDCSKDPQPAAGVYRSFDRSTAVAPLTIRTNPGSNYLVNLQDAIGGGDVISFFVRGGQDLDALVPLGTFDLEYVVGQFWCGDDGLFGDDTVIDKAKRSLSFYRDSISPVGHTITLIPQADGNLETRRIPRSEFWSSPQTATGRE